MNYNIDKIKQMLTQLEKDNGTLYKCKEENNELHSKINDIIMLISEQLTDYKRILTTIHDTWSLHKLITETNIVTLTYLKEDIIETYPDLEEKFNFYEEN